MKYQPHIDGLRAVAVVPVVMFHAGALQVSGGFIGVDVFFVISGYLITTIIAGEIGEGRFSIPGFYERRIRRIIPALFATLTAVLAASALIFLPYEFAKVPAAVVATIGFVSNFLFYHTTTYFGAMGRLQPLLHTWSLAIEEQYYLLLPLLLTATARLGRRWVIAIIAAIALASFGWNLAIAFENSRFAFYMTPTRGWELLTGSLLALSAPASDAGGKRWLREAAAAAGLVMILVSCFVFSNATPFPGWAALVPVTGTVLILAMARGTTTARLLSLPPLVWIGLISYSLYLWHWPIFVFAEYWRATPPNRWSIIIQFVLCFPIAWLSWRFIEQPFRRSGSGGRIGRHPLLAAGAGGAALLLLAGGAWAMDGWPQRFPAEAARIDSYRYSVNPRTQECDGTFGRCVYGAAVPPATAVWGDSHANALMPGLGETAARHHQSVTQYSLSGCPPALNSALKDRRCRTFNRSVTALLTRPDAPRTVILIGNLDCWRRNDANYQSGFAEVVARLQHAGKRVAISFPLPMHSLVVPIALAEAEAYRRNPDLGLPSAIYYRRNAALLRFLETVGGSNVVRVRTDRMLCGGAHCLIRFGRDVLVQDTSHPTIEGARVIAKLFEPLFEDSP